ncbi:class I SAM-dependent methyltransferase [Halosimplex salinum]|uniref:class I SAM-dependent methyltransferase n=1 Tax=Halosimplex salinum TaxID=1710538 RepID=UPI000F4ADE10|nr:class I SAM-dependent methyltransferase [Halosimplex salinum]
MPNDVGATQAFYGRWARAYDWLATAPGVESWREQAADALDLEAGDTVVEMGCGTGANFSNLRERVGAEGRIVGVDLTRGMLRRAGERIDRAGWENVHLARADARRPPVEGPVDAVLATFVVGMFADPRPAVERWIDTLAPGGRIALLNAGRSRRRVAAPFNLGFRAFVRLAAPGDGRISPTASLEQRVTTARDAVYSNCPEHGFEEFGLGYLGLAWGERPE